MLRCASEDALDLRLLLDSFHAKPHPEFAQAAFRIAIKGEHETLIPELVDAYKQLSLGSRSSLSGIMVSNPGKVKELIAISLLPIESALVPMINLLSCIDVNMLVGNDGLINAITQTISSQSREQLLSAKARRRLRRVNKRIEALANPSASLLVLRDACLEASSVS